MLFVHGGTQLWAYIVIYLFRNILIVFTVCFLCVRSVFFPDNLN